MSKLYINNLVECKSHATELRGVLLGYKKNQHDKPVFIYFDDRSSDIGNSNLHIFAVGKPGPGKRILFKMNSKIKQ